MTTADPIDLADRHLRELRDGSGLPSDVIAERGYRTVTDRGELLRMGFAEYQARVPALLVPIHGVDGSNSRYVLKPDHPRLEHRPDKPDHPIKYDYPAGQPNVLDVPRRCQESLADSMADLWITEGWKKADALAAAGKCVIALGGVWNWGHRDAEGNRGVPIDDWNVILPSLDGRRVFICFDSDAATNPNVGHAERRLTNFLRKHGAWVTIVRLPSEPDGSKNGVDDYIVRYGAAALDELAEAAEVAASEDVQALRTRVRELEQHLSAQAEVMRNPALRPTDKLVAVAVINETAWRASTGVPPPTAVYRNRIAEATGASLQTVSTSLKRLSGPGGMFRYQVARKEIEGQVRSIIQLSPLYPGGVVAQLKIAAHIAPETTAWGGKRQLTCPQHPQADIVVRHITSCTVCGQVLEDRATLKCQDDTSATNERDTAIPVPPLRTKGCHLDTSERVRPPPAGTCDDCGDVLSEGEECDRGLCAECASWLLETT